jgi:hypothetical protein
MACLFFIDVAVPVDAGQDALAGTVDMFENITERIQYMLVNC